MLSRVDSGQPHGPQAARLLCSWKFPAGILEQVPFPTPGDLPNPGIEPVPLEVSGGSFYH